ncbi:MAG: SulP family inorganic anion transporter [Dongiaceae bacterium]
MKIFSNLSLKNLHGDIIGGITVAVVALPLCLAFGVASGMGAIAGLYGAIFLGFFASAFGGSPAQISGPTGPMVVVMAGVVAQLHDLKAALAVIVLAGAIQIGTGLLKLGKYIEWVRDPVISGFMSGVGIIIIALQLGDILGHESPHHVMAAIRALPGFLQEISIPSLIVGLAALVISAIKLPNPRYPAPLLALIAGTLLAYFFFDIPTLGAIPEGLPKFILPGWSWQTAPVIIFSALVLALIGNIDSLLTASIADRATGDKHNSDRELIGQGIGNMLAGFFGGLVGSGAIMRTITNIKAGGRTPLSGMIHALVLLSLVLGLGPLASHIPHAVLAGILLVVGWNIIEWHYFKPSEPMPKFDRILMAIVMILTVLVNLIFAVVVGCLIDFAWQRWRPQARPING